MIFHALSAAAAPVLILISKNLKGATLILYALGFVVHVIAFVALHRRKEWGRKLSVIVLMIAGIGTLLRALLLIHKHARMVLIISNMVFCIISTVLSHLLRDNETAVRYFVDEGKTREQP